MYHLIKKNYTFLLHEDYVIFRKILIDSKSRKFSNFLHCSSSLPVILIFSLAFLPFLFSSFPIAISQNLRSLSLSSSSSPFFANHNKFIVWAVWSLSCGILKEFTRDPNLRQVSCIVYITYMLLCQISWYFMMDYLPLAQTLIFRLLCYVYF